MSIIYEPTGKALEYSPLAINLYNGCSHGCKYCYVPSIRRKTLKEWSASPTPRVDILRQLDKEAAKMAGDKREIMFSFMSDPYHSKESAALTREALLICEKHNLNCHVLTKGGMLAANDFDILQRNKWKFGSTIIFKSEILREDWEPNAATIADRFKAVRLAHEMGIFTWVSMEPVVNAAAALAVIRELRDTVDFWKVGKLNHHKIDYVIDWAKFLVDAERELIGKKFYIKKDLEAYR